MEEITKVEKPLTSEIAKQAYRVIDEVYEARKTEMERALTHLGINFNTVLSPDIQMQQQGIFMLKLSSCDKHCIEEVGIIKNGTLMYAFRITEEIIEDEIGFGLEVEEIRLVTL